MGKIKDPDITRHQLRNPVLITLSPAERQQVRRLKTPAYNVIIMDTLGDIFRGTVKSIINISRLTEPHHNYQGRVYPGGTTVVSSDKKVWVVPHHHATVVVKS